MKKLLVAAAVLFAAIAPARADYYVKDGNGALKLFKAGTLAGGVVLPYNSMTDASGLPFGTNSNPVAVKFGSGILLPDFANPQHVICDSGCSGGGGGGGLSVPFAGPIGANGTPVGFKDATGNLQPLLGDVTNGQWVSIKASVPIAVTGTFWQATQPVSGSVSLTGTLPAFAATPTFNLGTLNGAATAALQSSVQGTVAGGTAATASQLAGAIYNLTPLTLTNGQGAALQADANGYLRVNVMTGGGGSSPFGAAFPASGVALGMSQGGNLVGVTGTSGNLNVQCANCSGSGVSTVDKATFTASASLFAGSGGFFQTTATANALTTGQQGMFQVTAQRALFSNLRDSSGTELGVAAAPLQVSLANTAANGTALLVTGTGGTFPVTGPLTDTQLRASAVPVSLATLPALATGSNIVGRVGIDQTTPGTTNLVSIGTNGTVNPTTAANWGINTLGSTTSGQSGQLALGAVTTAAPTYTTAQSNALSLTTAGALRVDGSGVTQPVSLTSTTITGTVAVTQSGSWSLAANQSVNTAQINGVAPLMGNGVTGTGSLRVTIASDNTAFAVNAASTLAAETTKVIGTVRTLGNAGAIVDFAGQNATSPANAWLIGGQFNTTPTTITSGNSSPLQLDNAGNLKVNIIAGASSGAVAQGSTTAGQTGGLMQAAVTTAAPTYTTAQTSPLSLTTAGALRVANADIGSPSDAVCGTATGSCSMIALQKFANSAITGPLPTQASTVSIGGVGLFSGGTIMSATNGIYSNLLQGNAVISATNGLFSNLLQDNAALSATNGIYANLLVGNVAVLTGNGATGTGSPRVTIANDNSPVPMKIDQTTPGTTNAISVPLRTTGGWTKARLSGLSTTVTSVKNSAAGSLGMLVCGNPNASIIFIQVFDVATAGGVTLGSTAPDLSFQVDASSSVGFSLPVTGMAFANGIQMAATTTATGSTAPGSAANCNAGYN